jgi:hypothetical protein
MTPADIRRRRLALRLGIRQLSYAAAIGKDRVVAPAARDVARLDAVLAILEAGGTAEDARAAVGLQKAWRDLVPPTPPPPPPQWPEVTGEERLSGQCFTDAKTTDAGGRLPMRPATAMLRGSALGD